MEIGYDSRERIQSKEEELARFGMAWGETMPLPIVRPLGLRRRVRRKLARLLYAAAEWLSPTGVAAARASQGR